MFLKLQAGLTNADLSESVVREGVLAVSMRDGYCHPPVAHPRRELGPGPGVFLSRKYFLQGLGIYPYNRLGHRLLGDAEMDDDDEERADNVHDDGL